MLPSVRPTTSALETFKLSRLKGWPIAPLPTLRRNPRGCRRTARGRCGLLYLHRGGLSPPTPCRFRRRTGLLEFCPGGSDRWIRGVLAAPHGCYSSATGSPNRLLKKVSFRLQDSFVAIVISELDFDRAVVEEFGGSFALDLVAFVASGPAEADRVAGVFDFEDGLQGAEGDSPPCAVTVSVAGPQRLR
jgi:hypothetical protein